MSDRDEDKSCIELEASDDDEIRGEVSDANDAQYREEAARQNNRRKQRAKSSIWDHFTVARILGDFQGVFSWFLAWSFKFFACGAQDSATFYPSGWRLG